VTALAICPALVLGACGSSGGGSAKQTPLSAKQTIVFAVQGGTGGGVGSEGAAGAAEIAAFEQAHPNIKVKVLPLASTSDDARQQVVQYLSAGSATPDVIDSDSSWPANFARARWITPLDKFHPDKAAFMPGAVAATTYQGNLWAAMWYFNVEGLYYRTDLVKQVPKTTAGLVSAALAALKSDPSLRYGLAYEGKKYEGAVTAFMVFLGAFGGKLDPANMDTPQNVKALQFMHDLVYKYKLSPQAVTGWTEGEVANAFTSGQSVFSVNYPFVLQAAGAKGSKVAGKTAFVPFPSDAGTPTSTLASDVLTMNAKSPHQAAAWALIQWLMRPDQQIARAIASGDPPSVRAAYTQQLFAKAPYFKEDLKVDATAKPRLVNPNYQQITQALQDMISSVLANQQSPASALKSTSGQIKTLSTQ
jgi:multiple sugar transport system substrate-binding protein